MVADNPYSIAIAHVTTGGRLKRPSIYTSEMSLLEAVDTAESMLRCRRTGSSATVLRFVRGSSPLRFAVFRAESAGILLAFLDLGGEPIVQHGAGFLVG